MIKQIYDYYKNLGSPNDIVLGMSMMIRDEEDIIERNIRFHAAYGVDRFFIVNNASTDRTEDILLSLSKEYDITIFQNDDTEGHLQGEWMTKINNTALATGCDWVVNNDADEFWLPLQGNTLKYGLKRRDGSIRVERVNVLPIEGKDSVYESNVVTFNSVNYNKALNFSQGYVNHNLTNVMHKVMTNLHGLIRVSGGNHGAKHIADALARRRYTRYNENVRIYHYPIRTYEVFLKRMDRLKTVGDAGNLSQMGRHAIYWYDAVKKGRTEEAYKQLLVSPDDIPILEKYGIVRYDNNIRNSFSRLGL